MAKINETLLEEPHRILKMYQVERGMTNQGEALNALILEFRELLEIVTVLAKTPSPTNEGTPKGCILCRQLGQDVNSHIDSCPWLRARKIIGDLK